MSQHELSINWMDIKNLLMSSNEFRAYPNVMYLLDFFRKNLPKIQSTQPAVKKRMLFIPATNGGTISALAVLIALVWGHHVVVRIPRGGLDTDTEFVLERLVTLVECLELLNHQQYLEMLEDRDQSVFDLVMAWGNDQSKAMILSGLEAKYDKFVYFGSGISSSMIFVDEISARQMYPMAQDIARDILLFNQGGCTSTRQIFFVGSRYRARALMVCIKEVVDGEVFRKDLLSFQQGTASLFDIVVACCEGSDDNVFTFPLYEQIKFIKRDSKCVSKEFLETLKGGFVVYSFSSSYEKLTDSLRDNRVRFHTLTTNRACNCIGQLIADRQVPLGQTNSLDLNWGGKNLLELLA